MRSIRTKLMLALVVITLLPVYPLYHLVKNFFARSLEVGFNEKVVEALKNASGLSQIVFTHFREETIELCQALENAAEQRADNSMFSPDALTKIRDKFGTFRVIFFDKKSDRSRQYFAGDSLHYPRVFTAELQRLQAEKTMAFFETEPLPAFISVYVPGVHAGKMTGEIVVTRPLPPAFVQQSRRVIEVNQMFQAIGILRGDLERSFLLAFFVIYLSLTLLMIGLGWFISRRISRPLIALADGTEKVAAGDLNYRMQIDSGDEIGKLVGAFNSMIAKVKTKQEQVIDLEKKAAWREMARILAHEIKNPLTPIQLTVQQLRDEYRGDDPAYTAVLKECTEIILDEIAALQKLVRAFGDFARMPELQLTEANLNEIIIDLKKLYKGAKIDLQLMQNLPQLMLDEGQMRRVLKNLFKNSLESIDEKGMGEIVVRTSLHDRMVQLQFSDTGMGIKPEVLQRIFEPHYSTKKHGRGLGLAIVKRIILEHDGSIEAESIVGEGTTFNIQIPLNSESNLTAAKISTIQIQDKRER